MAADTRFVGRVYEIICSVDSRRFIGGTKQILSSVMSKNRQVARSEIQSNLHAEMRRLGIDNFHIHLLAEMPSVTSAELRAAAFKEMSKYDKNELFNIATTARRSQETLEKTARTMAARTPEAKARTRSIVSTINTMKGHRGSLVWREKPKHYRFYWMINTPRQLSESFSVFKYGTKEKALKAAKNCQDQKFPLSVSDDAPTGQCELKEDENNDDDDDDDATHSQKEDESKQHDSSDDVVKQSIDHHHGIDDDDPVADALEIDDEAYNIEDASDENVASEDSEANTGSRLYRIINDVNDKEYRGETTESIHERMNKHWRSALAKMDAFHTDMFNIGRDHFQISIIREFPLGTTKRQRVEAEAISILSVPEEKRYNIQIGAKHSQATRQKMSLSQNRGGSLKRESAWKVYYYLDGKRKKNKVFYVGSKSVDDNKERAIKWLNAKSPGLSDNETTKFTLIVNWVAIYRKDFKTTTKAFSVSKYGEEDAKARALAVLKSIFPNKKRPRRENISEDEEKRALEAPLKKRKESPPISPETGTSSSSSSSKAVIEDDADDGSE